MTMQNRFVVGIVLTLCALCVNAQDANAQKALAKAQFMLRQATAEKTTLEQENVALKQQVETLTKQLATSKSTTAARQQDVEQRFTDSIGKWRDSNEKLTAQVSEHRDQAKAQQQRADALEQQLKTQTDNFNQCYANNKKLYDVTKDLLVQYQNKGVMDAVKQKEPFTGIKQVEVENLIQGYQYKLDDLHVSLQSSTE